MSYRAASHKRSPQSSNKIKKVCLGSGLVLFLLLLLSSTAYVTAVANAKLPDLVAEATVATESNHLATAEPLNEAVAELTLPTAVSWDAIAHSFSNSDDVFAIASISKIVTVLVSLDAQPLPQDTADWPDLVLTEADAARMHDYVADGGVSYLMPPGSVVPLEDVFYLILLPSDNGFASAYAYSVFGDNDSFVDAVAVWAKNHGLDSLRLAEPTGMSEENVASLDDLLEIGRLALASSELAPFMTTKEAYVPGAGWVESTNPLLGSYPNVLGVKTGRTFAAGFNLLAAASTEIGGRQVKGISVTLGRDSLEERARSGAQMLDLLADSFVTMNIVDEGETVGYITGWDGEITPVFVADSFTTTLLPTEEVHTKILFDVPKGAFLAGTRVGKMIVTTPTETVELPLVTETSIVEPDFMWKLKNPQELVF